MRYIRSEMRVSDAKQYSLSDMDRIEYVKSQCIAHPEWADRLVDESFQPANFGKYPIFHREIIETGFVTDDGGQTWPTRKPGPLIFEGWMTPAEHQVYLERLDAARDLKDAADYDAEDIRG